MLSAEHFILSVSAFAAGLALGPVMGQPLRRLIGGSGVMAVLAVAALIWPTSRGILIDPLVYEVLGLGVYSVGSVVAALTAIAAVLLPLAFGATITQR